MTGGILAYGLLAALAIALLCAAITDLRARRIDNWLTFGIAAVAPLFWWASGLDLWPGVALQVGVAALVLAVLAGLFALGQMGGGDVKLLTALALWLPWLPFVRMLIVMSLVGLALTLLVVGLHYARKQPGRPLTPYGVAISIAGLWVLTNTYALPAMAGGHTGF